MFYNDESPGFYITFFTTNLKTAFPYRYNKPTSDRLYPDLAKNFIEVSIMKTNNKPLLFTFFSFFH